jgi:hypothetical protein
VGSEGNVSSHMELFVSRQRWLPLHNGVTWENFLVTKLRRLSACPRLASKVCPVLSTFESLGFGCGFEFRVLGSYLVKESSGSKETLFRSVLLGAVGYTFSLPESSLGTRTFIYCSVLPPKTCLLERIPARHLKQPPHEYTWNTRNSKNWSDFINHLCVLKPYSFMMSKAVKGEKRYKLWS